MKRRAATLIRRVPELREAIPAHGIAAGILAPSTRSVALMYGSVSPDIDMADAVTLAEIIVRNRRDAAPAIVDGLARELQDFPLVISMPWDSGYGLAQQIRDRFVDPQIDEPLDIDALLDRLEITAEETDLHDPDVRGVSVAGEHSRPVIVVNQSSGFNQSLGGKRFTIAHELCHLLVDRARGGELAIASGVWAPREIERRANSFGAMLLMPIRTLEARIPGPTITYAQLIEIANHFQTTPLATSSHLVNLGLIKRSNFEALTAHQL
jgi:Zn-dependent peptidase ImmA (M78 family)